MKPEISLIMSVYNGEDYIKETLDSVINQVYKNWEFIIINDCSNDSTEEILKEYSKKDERIKFYNNEENLRLPKSLNKAISLCSGKYIARMDADDICLPDRLLKQYNYMESNPDVDISSCRFLTLKNGELRSGGSGRRCDSDSVSALLLVTNPILHPGVIAKAEVIKELLYDTTVTCTEDLEIWTRAVMKNYNLRVLPEYLMIYRLHDKQITETTRAKQHEEVLKIAKTYFEFLLDVMPPEFEDYYINGIYFRDNIDVNKFTGFLKWAKDASLKKNIISSEDLQYAFFEILAEYRRCGISKISVIKALLAFSPMFLIKEIKARKKRAKKEGKKCILAARKFGYSYAGGPLEYPDFIKDE